MKKRVYIFLTISFLTIYAKAQDVKFLQTSIRDGLSQSTVNTIFQSRNGFLWIGTQDGLNKYNGVHFTVYRHQTKNKNSLSDNQIMSITEDKNGIIWIGTSAGVLNAYYPKEKKWKRFSLPTVEKGVVSKAIRTIYVDQQNSLWIGTEGHGLYQFDLTSESFSLIDIMINTGIFLSQTKIRDITQDSDGWLWLATFGDGLIALHPKSNQVKHYHELAKQDLKIPQNRVWSICLEGDFIWLGTNGGGAIRLNKKDGKHEVFRQDSKKPFSISGNQVWKIFKDSNGIIWLGTYGEGLNRFDSETKLFTKYLSDLSETFTLKDNVITALYEDQNKMLWIGTEKAGLHRLDLKPKKFQLLRNDKASPTGLSNNSVMAIEKDSNRNLWIGTYGGGLNIVEYGTGKIQVINTQSKPIKLPSNFVLSLKDDGQSMWIGTGNGLVRWPYGAKKIEVFSVDATGQTVGVLHNADIRVIHKNRTNQLWVGTNGGGLYRFESESGQFVAFKNRTNDTLSISSNTIRAIYEDMIGRLWIGTSNGLNLFQPDKNGFTKYHMQSGDSTSLSHSHVRTIHSTSDTTLWVGTASGLNYLNIKKNQFEQYFSQDGLPNDYIYGILSDQQGHIWLSTNRGLSRFKIQGENGNRVRNYFEPDGIQSDEFNGGAYYRDADGQLYFGGINGLTWFHPDQLTDSDYQPPIILTQFQILNKPAEITVEPYLLDKVKLKSKQNVFSFEFAALDYTHPERINYAYKMEPFEDDWVYSGNRRYVSYTNLDPETYAFKVKATNSDGVWSENVMEIAVVITPPIWKTWWFISGSLILLLSAVYFAGKIRQSFIEQQERERIEILRQVTIGVLHEIRQPLQVTAGHLEVIELVKDQPELVEQLNQSVKEAVQSAKKISNYLQKLESLLNQAKIKVKRYTKDQQMLDLTEEQHEQKNINS